MNQFLRAEPFHAGELLPQNLNRFDDVLFPDSVLPVLDRSAFSDEFVEISSDITVEISVPHDAISKPVICVLTCARIGTSLVESIDDQCGPQPIRANAATDRCHRMHTSHDEASRGSSLLNLRKAQRNCNLPFAHRAGGPDRKRIRIRRKKRI
jgi:hypothetical protein